MLDSIYSINIYLAGNPKEISVAPRLANAVTSSIPQNPALGSARNLKSSCRFAGNCIALGLEFRSLIQINAGVRPGWRDEWASFGARQDIRARFSMPR